MGLYLYLGAVNLGTVECCLCLGIIAGKNTKKCAFCSH